MSGGEPLANLWNKQKEGNTVVTVVFSFYRKLKHMLYIQFHHNWQFDPDPHMH